MTVTFIPKTFAYRLYIFTLGLTQIYKHAETYQLQHIKNVSPLLANIHSRETTTLAALREKLSGIYYRAPQSFK